VAEERRFPLVPVLLLSAALLFAFFNLYHVLIPFALGFAVAYVVNPVVTYFELKGIRRSAVVLALYLLAGAAVLLAAGTVIEIATAQFTSFQAQAPAYLAKSKAALASYQAGLVERLPYGYGAALSKQLDERLYGPLLDQAKQLPSYFLDIIPILTLLLLVPFVAFFLLMDGPGGIEGIIQSCPSRYVEQALHLISEIDSSLGSYLRGIITEASSIAGAAFVGLTILDVNQALPLAALAGVLTFVPELGILVSATTAGLVAGFQFGTFWAGLKVAGLFGAIKLVDYLILQPIIARHSVHLHPLVIVSVLMIGGELFGVIGLIFAVPVVCVLKSLAKVVWAWYSSEARLHAPEMLDSSALPYT
jgi:predicted PurR-regulated permease PerM